ncbi:MAG TPA: hypothetical protein PLO82_10760 [Bacteroidia bacterium]|nr:hypothetical protein [Bacteroidia bacterium]
MEYIFCNSIDGMPLGYHIHINKANSMPFSAICEHIDNVMSSKLYKKYSKAYIYPAHNAAILVE